MILKELFDTFEELKKNVYIINRGDKNPLIIKFKNEHFFHLVGLHKTNIKIFIPNYITSKDKVYKYIKKNLKKFNNILLSEMKEEKLLTFRVSTFNKIIDLLNENNQSLYSLKPQKFGSMYEGDFGLLKIYENYNCLLALIIDEVDINAIKCAPQSWMVSDRVNQLINGKKPIYMKNISVIPKDIYENNFETIGV